MMQGFVLRALACLVVLTSFSVMPTAEAATRGASSRRKAPTTSRLNEDLAYSLDDVMKRPREFLEREVFFYCRFATTANLFKNVNTRFNSTEHTNFAVWPDKTILWEAKGRKNVLPTLYLSKMHPETIEMLRTVRQYELLAITGTVLNVYSGFPWILVTKIERVELPGDALSEITVQHMQNGHEALMANAGGVAARHFEQALMFGLPPEYCAKAFEQIAQAYLLDNRLDKARDFLRQAVELNREDAILSLALADVALRMGDADEALAHSIFAMERSGRYPQVYGIMGEADSLNGDFVKAFGNLNIAAGTPGITPRELAMVNVRRARIFARAGRFPDAARTYAAASESGQPLAGEAWLHYEIGLFYEKLYLNGGDPRFLDSAFTAYEEASRLDRLDPAILYSMAEVEFRRQRLSETPDFHLTREILNRLAQTAPEYTPGRIVEARVLFAEGKTDEAEFIYQSIASQIGDDAMALMALAEVYGDLGKIEEASFALNRARSLRPWDGRIKTVGVYLEQMVQDLLAYREEQAHICEAPSICEAPAMRFAAPVQTNRISPPCANPPPAAPRPAPSPAPQAAPPPASQPAPEAASPISPAGLEASRNSLRPPASGQLTVSGRTEAGLNVTAAPGDVVGAHGNAVSATKQYAVPLLAEMRGEHMTSIRQSGGRTNVPKTEVRLAPEPAPASKQAPSAEPRNPRLAPLDLDYTPSLSQAYASLIEPDLAGARGGANEDIFAPVTFSFSAADSPLITDFRAPGEAERDMPVRNANVFRPAGPRRPAEITERENTGSVAPDDAFAMQPPQDGGIYRTELRLPSSAPGIGMTSDYVESK